MRISFQFFVNSAISTICVLLFNLCFLPGLCLTQKTAACFSDNSNLNQTQLLFFFLACFSGEKNRFVAGLQILREEAKSLLKLPGERFSSRPTFFLLRSVPSEESLMQSARLFSCLEELLIYYQIESRGKKPTLVCHWILNLFYEP